MIKGLSKQKNMQNRIHKKLLNLQIIKEQAALHQGNSIQSNFILVSMYLAMKNWKQTLQSFSKQKDRPNCLPKTQAIAPVNKLNQSIISHNSFDLSMFGKSIIERNRRIKVVNKKSPFPLKQFKLLSTKNDTLQKKSPASLIIENNQKMLQIIQKVLAQNRKNPIRDVSEHQCSNILSKVFQGDVIKELQPNQKIKKEFELLNKEFQDLQKKYEQLQQLVNIQLQPIPIAQENGQMQKEIQLFQNQNTLLLIEENRKLKQEISKYKSMKSLN